MEICQVPPAEEAPPEEEPSQLNDGDDLSVFKTLASELDPNVGGPDDYCTCNLGKETEHFVQLHHNSTVSCRILNSYLDCSHVTQTRSLSSFQVKTLSL